MAAVLLALILAVQAAPGATQGPDASAGLFAHAVELQQTGQLEAAADAYKQFLRQQPRSVEGLANLGVVYAKLARYDEAIAAYEQALHLSSRSTPIRRNLALAYYKSARCAEAVREFDLVLDASPGAPDVTLLKADCLVQTGEYAKAVDLLRPFESTLGDERVFNYVYGMALLQNKQTEEGLRQIDRILRNGDSAEAHLLLGISQRSAGDFAAARDEFAKAIAANPDLPVAHGLYGQALLTAGDREAARRAFETELKTNPGDFESNLYLGVIAKEEQRLDVADELFQRAQRIRPGDPGVRYQLATLALARGENEQALQLLEPLVAESPTFTEAHVSLATVYYRLKRKEDGDRERAIVDRLTKDAQSRQPAPTGGGQ